MTISTRHRVVLWGRAAGRCAFPDCRKHLVYDKSQLDSEVLLGEIAHIAAQKRDGPRGRQTPPGGDIDGYDNTILLCSEHHSIIDGQPEKYPVEKLVQLRTDHEDWVHSHLSPREQYSGLYSPADTICEQIFSTMLPVRHIPRFVHVAACTKGEDEVRELIQDVDDPTTMAPFIIRGGNLLTFCDLDDERGPFRTAIDPYGSEKHNADVWWDDPVQGRWYVDLLNRALNKLTGRRGLNLDKEHRRYYFEPENEGRVHSVDYRSIGGRQSNRLVAWQPEFRHSGEKKNYWEHLAVGLRFHRLSKNSWCLSIRPERRFTIDGYRPLTPKGTGRRSTSRKSRMYNLDVLKEVHFWRDFFSRGTPRIVLKFGRQSVVISTDILTGSAEWPPISGDMKRHVKTIYEDDLFSLADYNEAIEFDDKEAFEMIEEPADEEVADET